LVGYDLAAIETLHEHEVGRETEQLNETYTEPNLRNVAAITDSTTNDFPRPFNPSGGAQAYVRV